jgi:hypothetical protein
MATPTRVRFKKICSQDYGHHGKAKTEKPQHTGGNHSQVNRGTSGKRIFQHSGSGPEKKLRQVFQQDEKTDGNHDGVDVGPAGHQWTENEPFGDDPKQPHHCRCRYHRTDPTQPTRNPGHNENRNV